MNPLPGLDSKKTVKDKSPELLEALDLAQALLREFNGKIVDATSGTCAYYGYTYEEMVGYSIHLLLQTEFPKPLAEIESELSRTGRWSGELKHRSKDGSVLWVASQWILNRRSGCVDLITEVNNDITALKRAEQEGLQSCAHLELALDTAGLGTWKVNCETGTISIGRRASEILGCRKSVGSIDEWLKSIHPDDRDQVRNAIAEPLKLGSNSLLEYRALREDGSIRLISALQTPLPDTGDGSIKIGVVHDVTSQQESERLLRESEARLRRLTEANVVGIVVANQRRILETNEYFLRMLGMTREDFEKDDFDWRAIVAEEYVEVSEKVIGDLLLSGKCDAYETKYRHKNGSLISALVGSVVLQEGPEPLFLSLVLNLTEQKRLEDQFRQAQKLESVGLLAGGVAHDFNNLLTVISGYSELALGEMEKHDPHTSFFEEISQAAGRAAALTRQLLTFSRQQELQPKITDVNQTVQDVVRMLSRLIGENIELELSLRADPSTILVDPGQLDQVVINLAINSRDAMRDGGKLIIETSNFDVDERFANSHLEVDPGMYLMLSITDTGIGMAPDIQRHMFEPFFTTKEQGQGTGLGLSTVYGIVKQSQGSIWVYSEPGNGTTFKILFPSLKGTAPSPVPEQTRFIGAGHETILVAEDEIGVRRFIQEVLERHGYSVITAANGKEAIDRAREYNGPIHLLMTDVVMPEMGGSELAEKFKSICAGVPILRMSGYNHRPDRQKDKGDLYIEKPFTPRGLIQRVRTLIDSRSQSPDA